MPHGVDTPQEVLDRFRAHYLVSGNASEAATEVGLPQSTGRDIAQRLRKDEEFVAARRQLRDDYLDELVAMRQRMARGALRRFEEALVIPEPGNGPPVTVVDKRYEYGKLVNDAEKNAHKLAQLDGPVEQSDKAITFNVVLKSPLETNTEPVVDDS